MGLPNILKAAYRSQRERLAGSTTEMVQGAATITDVLEQILVHLAQWFPKNNFGDMSANRYFSHYVGERYKWRRALIAPKSSEPHGTICGPLITHAVMSDMSDAVEDMVRALLYGREGFYRHAWEKAWRESVEAGEDA